MRQLAAAIRAFLSRMVTVTKWVGGRLVTTTQAVIEAVPQAAQGVFEVADTVALSPFRLVGRALRAVTGQGAPAPTEGSVARQAAGAEAVQQQASERTADRQMLRAVRSIARARADGVELWPNLGDGGMREAAYRGG